MTDRTLKIGLPWHSPNSGNLGVGALTLSNMAIVREVAEGMGLAPRFLIVSMRDRTPSYVDPSAAEVFWVDRKSTLAPSGLWRAIGAQDCIIDIGAGDSFTDIYGARRFAFMWLTKAMAIARRRPLIMAPQTIGPFTRTPYKQLAAWAMARAAAVVARDPKSLAALNALSPAAKSVLATDVAFALPFLDRSGERGGKRRRVGVNVSGLLFNEAVSGRNRFGLDIDYAELMRGFLADLTARQDCEVHLFAHVTGADPIDDDGRVADQLAAEFPSAIRVANFPGPCEAKSYISSLDIVVAARMHACIAALSARTAVVPIAYSRKFSGIFNALGYPWLVDVKGQNTQDARAYLNDCLGRRDELAAGAAKGMARVQSLLDAYRAELRKLFADLAA